MVEIPAFPSGSSGEERASPFVRLLRARRAFDRRRERSATMTDPMLQRESPQSMRPPCGANPRMWQRAMAAAFGIGNGNGRDRTGDREACA
ncbi:MAG TPA: hypothetical protein VGR63_13155 [Casimicrobiaceae bacterium]|nr:hypothetical protein [Casimicrobiaceae bacterium]